jgi:hypothetical protein
MLRGWDVIVIGEYERAFYGGQYASMAPLSEHFGIQLWMPEVGGRIDFHAEDHEEGWESSADSRRGTAQCHAVSRSGLIRFRYRWALRQLAGICADACWWQVPALLAVSAGGLEFHPGLVLVFGGAA